MLDIRFQRFHLESTSFEHVPPFARAILPNVRFVMIGIQSIHAFIKEVILRHASIIDDDYASAAQNAPHFTKCLPDVGKMMRRPAAGHEIEAFVAVRQKMRVTDLECDVAQCLVLSKPLRFGKHLPGEIDASYRSDMWGE